LAVLDLKRLIADRRGDYVFVAASRAPDTAALSVSGSYVRRL
jgi:hypothetical protein